MGLARFVREGEMYPKGYGLAWRTWERPGGIAYPVPLNYLAGFLHDLWLDMRTPKALRDDVWSEGLHSAAFRRGVEAGRGMERKASNTLHYPGIREALSDGR